MYELINHQEVRLSSSRKYNLYPTGIIQHKSAFTASTYFSTPTEYAVTRKNTFSKLQDSGQINTDTFDCELQCPINYYLFNCRSEFVTVRLLYTFL